MNNYIVPFDKIITHIEEEIYPFLSEPISEEPEVVIERGNMMHSYMAILAKYNADAKFHANQAMLEAIKKCREEKIPQGLHARYCDASIATETQLVDIIAGLLKKCYCENDWNRTLVSKAKEEINANKKNNGN